MKKRTACKIITGAVTMCVLVTGHCGRIELSGDRSVTLGVRAEIAGESLVKPDALYSVNTGCIVCESYYGPCVGSTAKDIRIVSRQNVGSISMHNGTWMYGKRGSMIEWAPGRVEEPSNVVMEITCDNAVNKDWTWVDIKFFRDRRYPTSRVRVTATNLVKGVTEVSPDAWLGSEWNPKWGAVVGRPGDRATVSLSYADEVVLRGANARARILYDVVGTAPVNARIDKLPPGLTCARTSDWLTLAAGASADIGPGDSITCANVLRKKETTRGTLSVTAMIR